MIEIRLSLEDAQRLFTGTHAATQFGIGHLNTDRPAANPTIYQAFDPNGHPSPHEAGQLVKAMLAHPWGSTRHWTGPVDGETYSGTVRGWSGPHEEDREIWVEIQMPSAAWAAINTSDLRTNP